MQSKHKNRTKTSHLSLGQIENLKSDYYSGKNTKDLVKKYNIDIHPNNLCSTFPLVKTPDKRCKYCKSIMYFIPPLKNSKNRKEYFCTICLHKESLFGCKCNQCLTAKGAEILKKETERYLDKKTSKEKKSNIREYPESPSFAMLSVKEKAYLGALLRAHLYKDFLLIDLSNNSTQIFAPTAEYRELIIAELLDKKIIAPYKPEKEESQEIINRYSYGALYDICINDANMNKAGIISSLMYQDKVSFSDEKEVFGLLREVHLHEATEYMMLMVQKFNLYVFDAEDKYIILFSQILNRYSTSQLFNFIFTAVRNLAAYRSKNYKEYLPMSNYIYKSISNRYEKAQMDNWKITNFTRAWKGPQSELSQIVSNSLLDIGESAFYQVTT